MLGKRFPRAVQDDGEDVHLQLVRQIEGALVEAADAAVQGACALGIDGDAVPLVDQFAEARR